MSFNFSQSLLGDISSYPGPLSQELDTSQDSGYAVSYHPNTFQAPPPGNFPPSAPPLFPPRRTLSRPPTWPNLPLPEQGESKWKFGGRQEIGRRAPLERDLQQHLQDLSRQANNVPGKISTVVEESVKYLQDVYGKGCVDERREFVKTEKSLYRIKEKVIAEDKVIKDVKEDIFAMETGLAECAVVAAAVTAGGERIRDRLASLLQLAERESIISMRLKEEAISLAKRYDNQREVDVLAKTMVVEGFDKMYDDRLSFTSPACTTRQVSYKRVPSIRRLPTLPLLGAETAHRAEGQHGQGVRTGVTRGRIRRVLI